MINAGYKARYTRPGVRQAKGPLGGPSRSLEGPLASRPVPRPFVIALACLLGREVRYTRRELRLRARFVWQTPRKIALARLLGREVRYTRGGHCVYGCARKGVWHTPREIHEKGSVTLPARDTRGGRLTPLPACDPRGGSITLPARDSRRGAAGLGIVVWVRACPVLGHGAIRDAHPGLSRRGRFPAYMPARSSPSGGTRVGWWGRLRDRHGALLCSRGWSEPASGPRVVCFD